MKKNLKLISVAILFLFFIYISVQLFIPSDIGSNQMEIEIPEGSTYKQALEILKNKNLIRDKNLFYGIGIILGIDRKIRAGYYVFWGDMSPFEVFKKLAKGEIIENEITIIEGDSVFEIKDKLVANNIMSAEDFDKLVKDPNFLNSLNIKAPSLEGYLFPETYKFPKGTKPESVLRLMVQKMREEFNDELRRRAEEIGFSENDVLTLASIIEREARIDEERELISAVYHNRIKKGMPLQADPTAVYGIKGKKQRITRDDLKRKTDYNTYIIKGLPPGPIASPGIKSIRAALYPADVPYLYFVSNRDGSHYFSKTLSEHNAAIIRIQAKRDSENRDLEDLSKKDSIDNRGS